MKAHEYVVLEIARERERQMAAEGWEPEHDDEHDDGELALAAAAYAVHGIRAFRPRSLAASTLWPWERGLWNPKDRRRNLIRAAALIVAEIERLDRATPTEPPPHG